MSNFKVLETMSLRNMKIKSFPLDNLRSASTGKLYGTLTICVDNETVRQIMYGDRIVFSLIIADGNEFDQVKAELDEKGGE